MIHIQKEGALQKSGLNIIVGTLGRPWISFSWFTVDLISLNVIQYYCRIRLYLYPWIMCSKHIYNFLENYLGVHDLIIIKREEYENLYKLSVS